MAKLNCISIGFYHDQEDLNNLSGKSADEIMEYYNKGLGNFTKSTGDDFKPGFARADGKIYGEQTSDYEYIVCDNSRKEGEVFTENSYIDILKISANEDESSVDVNGDGDPKPELENK